jgi:hypothetical protein
MGRRRRNVQQRGQIIVGQRRLVEPSQLVFASSLPEPYRAIPTVGDQT